jgi:poly(3-hydroxybutyrate) depolymerase
MLTLKKKALEHMKSLTLLLLCTVTCFCSAQQRIDGSFAFQTDPSKNYSLYIPSGYDSSTPHRLMIGFHPFNTNRWDAEAWCDTLTAFAEFNNLILACPDGGADGSIDDPIDTALPLPCWIR